jgi:hypothetical protein
VNRLATSAIDLYASAALNENRGTDTLNKDDSDQLAALYSIRSVAQEENEKISDAVTDLERAMNLSEAVRHGYILHHIVYYNQSMLTMLPFAQIRVPTTSDSTQNPIAAHPD